jgi:hypothetical protein
MNRRIAFTILYMAGWLLSVGMGFGSTVGSGPAVVLAAEPQPIANPEAYFPDTMGSRWRYRGQVIESPLQKIDMKRFENVSTVQGTETQKGVAMKVYHDTNPGNHGPSDSYYRRDAAGIVYYGSQPGTPLEKQLVPYQIVRFPLMVPSSFQQFNRTGLSLGSDLDGDEKDERADVEAVVTMGGRETVSVPAGSYQDCIRLEARLTMHIHLTREKRTVHGTDVMTAWFAKGVGLVKYVERQELPALKSDRGVVTEITEELEEVQIKTESASLGGSEAAAQRVLADHPGHHELLKILLAARLRAQSGQAVAPKRLPAH